MKRRNPAWLDSFAQADEQTIPARLIRSRDPNRGPCTARELGLDERRSADGPLVSVIIPTCDDSEYIPDALESIGGQTYGNLEVIFVDSSGVQWIEGLAEECQWIRYISKQPQGVSAARNEGIARASGEYIALLDADDYWHPEKIERQVRALQRGSDASYTCHYFIKFWGNDDPVIKVRDCPPDSKDTAYVETFTGGITAHTSTLMFRSSAVSDRPFDVSMDHFEDVVFAVELFKTHPPEYLSDPLSVRRLREGSLADRTSQEAKRRHRIRAYNDLSRRHPELLPYATRMKAVEEFKRGWAALERGDDTEARRCFKRCLRYRPSHYKAMGVYAAALLPLDGRTVCRTLDRAFSTVRDRLDGRHADDATDRDRVITVLGQQSDGSL